MPHFYWGWWLFLGKSTTKFTHFKNIFNINLLKIVVIKAFFVTFLPTAPTREKANNDAGFKRIGGKNQAVCRKNYKK